MPVGTTPIFVATPKSPGVRIATANTNLDGTTGTYGTLFTAGTNGSFFQGIDIIAEATNTAGWVAIFKQDAGAGNVELLAVVLMAATTVSATVAPVTGSYYPPGGIQLSASSVLKCSTRIAETYALHCSGGGDY